MGFLIHFGAKKLNISAIKVSTWEKHTPELRVGISSSRVLGTSLQTPFFELSIIGLPPYLLKIQVVWTFLDHVT